MSNWSALRAKIKAKLDGLVTAGTLGSVLNGEHNPQDVEMVAYPCAEIVRMGTEPDYFTNREDIQSYIFHIRIYQQLPDDDWATVELSLDDTVDAVMQAFLDDASLTGTADARIEPIQNGGSVLSWNGKLHYRDLVTLKCRKITAMA